jgi:hypothetical protein
VRAITSGITHQDLLRRAAPRAVIELPVALVRPHGNAVPSRTVDVGPGGMRVRCDRPLHIDELLAFDLDCPGAQVSGRARVLREHVGSTYALRFEWLGPDAMVALRRLAAG